MKIGKTLYVKNRHQWRAWLQQHHATEKEIWLISYKKSSARPRIPYDDAVEEALCFGWIDSLVYKIDEDRYAQKFSPRHMKSKWSEPNKRRVAKMIRERQMTEAGRAKITYPHPEAWQEPASKPQKPSVRTPPAIKRALSASPKAWENFTRMAPSYRRIYIRWIMDAKRPETRERRVGEAIQLLEENKPLGMR